MFSTHRCEGPELQPDDVRAALVKEIRRREHQLASLREALAQLDAALQAATAAHAASVAAAERSMAAQAAAATQTLRSGMHAVAAPPVTLAREFVSARTAPAVPKAERNYAVPAPAPAPVTTSGASTHAHHRPVPSGRYANMKVWRAVQEMLTEHRKSMTLEEIVHKLQEGGATLGDSPVRTVSTAVGYMNDKIFHVAKTGGETYVNLLRPAEF
ncbi:MAG: hypothetical protein JSS87_15515 [Acidobacteria bacterium]|nr:hypothetical protein [Acidobacteriota bacterium]